MLSRGLDPLITVSKMNQKDRDGIIWPRDTFIGFYRLGFGAVLSFLSIFVIHSNFSYATGDSWIPDPMFRINLSNIHKDKHGSASGAYDAEGRFVPQRFEDLFAKHAQGRDYMTARDVVNLLKGQRMIADPVGWFHAFIECESFVSFKVCKIFFPASKFLLTSPLAPCQRDGYLLHAVARGRPHEEGGCQGGF